jgi:hypothetical protein
MPGILPAKPVFSSCLFPVTLANNVKNFSVHPVSAYTRILRYHKKQICG